MNVDSLDSCGHCEGYAVEPESLDEPSCPGCFGKGGTLAPTILSADFYQCKCCGHEWGRVPPGREYWQEDRL